MNYYASNDARDNAHIIRNFLYIIFTFEIPNSECPQTISCLVNIKAIIQSHSHPNFIRFNIEG